MVFSVAVNIANKMMGLQFSLCRPITQKLFNVFTKYFLFAQKNMSKGFMEDFIKLAVTVFTNGFLQDTEKWSNCNYEKLAIIYS